MAARLIRARSGCVKFAVDAHETDDFLAIALDAATGAATPAEALLVEARATLRGDCARDVGLADALGGALLDRIHEAAPTVGAAPVRAARDPEAFARARAALLLARHDPDAIAWSTPIPGVRTIRLPATGARLIRLRGGDVLPAHGHVGEERTLVLRGAFEDEHGKYEPGDMAFCTHAHVHAPRALAGDDCICLIVSTGEMRFRGLIERAAYHFLWR